jgi:predicted lysophospholipase L1 biosynthesis ABC-type transport system permease subunit
MRIASLLFFEIAAATLTATGYSHGLPELATTSIFLGVLAFFAFFRPAFVHATLGLYGILTGVFGLFHMPPLLCAGALTAALLGWDAGLIAPQVSRASAEDRRRFALVYTLRALALAAIGILLVAAAGTMRISLTFGSGLGLSFAVLVLAALFIRTLHRAEASESDARSDRK